MKYFNTIFYFLAKFSQIYAEQVHFAAWTSTSLHSKLRLSEARMDHFALLSVSLSHGVYPSKWPKYKHWMDMYKCHRENYGFNMS